MPSNNQGYMNNEELIQANRKEQDKMKERR
jgi:hypothetical protein